MPRLPLLFAFVAALLLLASDDMSAQGTAFRLHGQVLDPMGAPIAGARLTSSTAGDAGPSAVADGRGEFVLHLADGRYTVTVSVMGFTEVVREVTAVQGGDDSWQVRMEIAGIHESVSVNAPPGYRVDTINSATKTPTPLRDVPQSITVITQELIRDQLMTSVGDVVRYVPGIVQHQGENNRDQLVIRGNSTSADFFVNGVRDDVQYFRDLYNLQRVEALKGPNALMFGRGGAGGVINRVTKEAGFGAFHQFTFQGGSYDNRRVTADLNRALNDSTAVRLNGMFENSNSFRSGVGLERYGVSPTVTLTPSTRTRIVLGYEYLNDTRVADRGIPSFQGRPLDIDVSTFFGNPDDSYARSSVHLGSAAIEHRIGGLLVRNRTLIGSYDRKYQNFVPGAVNAAKTEDTLTAYNNATARTNLFNQTDVSYGLATGPLRHTLLAGAEIGRQSTDNFRTTGFFNNLVTSIQVPLANTVIATPVTFRQSATDADNHLTTLVGAVFAQDQIVVSPQLQLLAGLRFDRFELQYTNNRNGSSLTRPDMLPSPRAGIVYKPRSLVSLYGSYSVSYLPSSGDQFSSLTAITQQLEPEKFSNYEAGFKWDSRDAFSLTAAVYRLDRTNTRSTDPNDPTRIVQTGSQRTNGFELGVNGQVSRQWRVAGGYAYQDAFVSSATAAASAGARVAQVPPHTFSLWNNYQVRPRIGGGLGLIYRSDMFASIDNTVTLPGYLRADAAGFLDLTRTLRVQVNVENLFDARYYANADNNNNISPGVPRTVRIALTTSF